jgi:hypothetical protein
MFWLKKDAHALYFPWSNTFPIFEETQKFEKKVKKTKVTSENKMLQI